MVFVDGLGCGPPDPESNPVYSARSKTLASLLADSARPIDACLGVPGLPQSATGQTALLTGQNAPALMGRHIEGFPGEPLRQLIHNHSLLAELVTRGLSATFANAYYTTDIQQVHALRRKSVTTVASLHAFGSVRLYPALYRNDAVYQDLTRERLRGRGYDGPLITPEEAAQHLLGIAADHHFTLFEYFQTDRAGHRADRARAACVLEQLDAFVATLAAEAARMGIAVILTSDHGNIEDLRTRAHTQNPVPFLVFGRTDTIETNGVDAITDVAPCILQALRSAAL